MWRAIYRVSDGRLVSVGTVWPDPLPEGLGYIEFTMPQNPESFMWDAAVPGWVARPSKVLTDRFQEILAHPLFDDFQQVWQSLPGGRRSQLTTALNRLCGGKRWRASNEPLHPME